MSDITKSYQNISKQDNDKIPNIKEFIKNLDQIFKLFDKHIADEEFENKNSDIYKLFISLFNIYKDLDSKNITKTNNMCSLSNHVQDKLYTSSIKKDSDDISISIHDQNKSYITPIKKDLDSTNNHDQDQDQDKSYINTSNHDQDHDQDESYIIPVKKDLDDININSIVTQHIENRKKQKKESLKWENVSRFESDRIAHKMYQKSLMDLQTTDKNGPITFLNKRNMEKNSELINSSSIYVPSRKTVKNNKLNDDNKLSDDSILSNKKIIKKMEKNKHKHKHKYKPLDKIDKKINKYQHKDISKNIGHDIKENNDDLAPEQGSEAISPHIADDPVEIIKKDKNITVQQLENSNNYTDYDNSYDIFTISPKERMNQIKTEEYEKTDDIDKKIDRLKKILNK